MAGAAEGARGRVDPRSILEAVAVGYLMSCDTRIVEVNQILCRTLGFEREELLDMELPWPFTPPEGLDISLEMAPRMNAEALARGYSDPVELPLMRKDGSRFMGEVIISPVRDTGGDIVGWVTTIRDVSKRHDYEAELERLARHDPLTGLPNRRMFDERLDAEMADAIRHDRSLGVAILDLDGFKGVNDRHGHPAGDRA